MQRVFAVLGLAMTLGLAGGHAAWADDTSIVELSWQKLIPVDAAQDPLKSKSFAAGSRNPQQQGSEPPPPPNDPEASWMSQRRLQPGTGGPVKVVQDFNGQRVHIGGYVVPLDFDATTIKEFLLVPYVGACIHVPPPPPNQIIYVKSAQGFEIKANFDPVYVTGKLTTTQQFTGLAETGYTIEADSVELKK